MRLPAIAFFDIPYHSRLMTTLPLIRALVAKGHPVYAFTLEPYRKLVESTGAQCVLQPGFGVEPPLCTVNLRTIDYSMTAVPALVETLRQLKPAVVVHTAKCLWAALAAEICGLPTVGLHTNALMPRGVPVSAEVFAHRWPGMDETVLAELDARDARAWKACAHHFASTRIDARDVLPGMPNCMNLRGDLNLVYCSERLQPHRQHFDEHYHFVGPCYEARTEDADPAFEAQLELLPRPLIYASLGSMRLYNERQHVFLSVLDACRGGKRGVVMSVGGETFGQNGAPLPSHVLARPYVPQLAVLEKASVFITHAGTNSVYESLLAGVPMLMLPQGGDQPIVAEHVEALGLGLWLRTSDQTPPTHRPAAPTTAPGVAQDSAQAFSQEAFQDALQKAIERLMDDSDLLAKVRHAGMELREAGGLPRATELVSNFVQGAVRERA